MLNIFSEAKHIFWKGYGFVAKMLFPVNLLTFQPNFLLFPWQTQACKYVMYTFWWGRGLKKCMLCTLFDGVEVWKSVCFVHVLMGKRFEKVYALYTFWWGRGLKKCMLCTHVKMLTLLDGPLSITSLNNKSFKSLPVLCGTWSIT